MILIVSLHSVTKYQRCSQIKYLELGRLGAIVVAIAVVKSCSSVSGHFSIVAVGVHHPKIPQKHLLVLAVAGKVTVVALGRNMCDAFSVPNKHT